jgi:large subunit ribosomal protein L13
MKTTHLKPGDRANSWYLVDAKDLVLGRLATRLALILRGKHKPGFTPHLAVGGDCIVVVNVGKMKITGNKLATNSIKRYTLYPGGLKHTPWSVLMAKRPERILRHAVWGMLPRSIAGRRQIRSLKLYRGPDHPHTAQMPVKVDIMGRSIKVLGGN